MNTKIFLTLSASLLCLTMVSCGKKTTENTEAAENTEVTEERVTSYRIYARPYFEYNDDRIWAELKGEVKSFTETTTLDGELTKKCTCYFSKDGYLENFESGEDIYEIGTRADNRIGFISLYIGEDEDGSVETKSLFYYTYGESGYVKEIVDAQNKHKYTFETGDKGWATSAVRTEWLGEDSVKVQYVYTYPELDEKGNWLKRVADITFADGSRSEEVSVRELVYW